MQPMLFVLLQLHKGDTGSGDAGTGGVFLDLWDFLLPEWGNPLDVAFFLLLTSLLVGGIVAARRAPDSWKYDNFSLKYGSLNELSLSVSSGYDRFAQNLPGLLLTVGLLGTFLGIGMAISRAQGIFGADQAQPDQVMGSLGPVLSGIGLKFKCSVWGITFSLLFRLYIAASGLDGKRTRFVLKEIRKEATRDSETDSGRWGHIKRLDESLSSLPGRLQEFHTENLNKLAQQIEGNAQVVAAVVTTLMTSLSELLRQNHSATLVHLSQLMEGIGSATSTINQRAADLSAGARKHHTESLAHLSEQLKLNSKAASAALDKQATRVSDLMRDAHAQSLSNFNSQLAQALATLTKAADERAGVLSAQLREQHFAGMKHTAEHVETYAGLLISQTADNHTQTLRQLQESQGALDSIRVNMNNLAGAIASVDKLAAEMQATAAVNARTLKAAAEGLGGSVGSLQGSVDLFEKRVGGVMSAASQSLERMGDDLRSSINDLTAGMGQAFADFSAKSSNSLESIGSNLSGSILDMKSGMEAAFGHFSANVDSLLGQIETNMERATAGINVAIKTSMEGIARAQEESSGKVREATEGLQKEVGGLAVATAGQLTQINDVVKHLNNYMNHIAASLELLTASLQRQNMHTEKMFEETEKMTEQNARMGIKLSDVFRTDGELSLAFNSIKQGLVSNQSLLDEIKGHLQKVHAELSQINSQVGKRNGGHELRLTLDHLNQSILGLNQALKFVPATAPQAVRGTDAPDE